MFVYGRVEDEGQALLYSKGYSEKAADFFEQDFDEVRDALAGSLGSIRLADTLKFVAVPCGRFTVYLVCDSRLDDLDVQSVVQRVREEYGRAQDDDIRPVAAYIDYLLDDKRVEDDGSEGAHPWIAARIELCTRGQRFGLAAVGVLIAVLVVLFVRANSPDR